MAEPLPDKPTLIAISALAYVLAVALHEHAGHTCACVLLGSHATELGAFFVNCDDGPLSAAAVRTVAVAGPVMSLFTGVVSLTSLCWVPASAPRAFYFLWLLGSIGLMSAAGYPVFSGIAGIGDLGTGAGGALQGARPEWLWRAVLVLLGAVGYWLVARLSVRLIAPRLPGSAEARVRGGKRITLISYVTGAIVYLAIGVFNPYGVTIVLISVLPSSLGGTSGLVWMMDWLAREPEARGPDLNFARSAGWVVAAVIVTVAYAIVLGPR